MTKREVKAIACTVVLVCCKPKKNSDCSIREARTGDEAYGMGTRGGQGRWEDACDGVRVMAEWQGSHYN